ASSQLMDPSALLHSTKAAPVPAHSRNRCTAVAWGSAATKALAVSLPCQTVKVQKRLCSRSALRPVKSLFPWKIRQQTRHSCGVGSLRETLSPSVRLVGAVAASYESDVVQRY